MKKCGACGSVIPGDTNTFLSNSCNGAQMGYVLCEFYFSTLPDLVDDQEAVVVEGMPEAVVEDGAQVHVFV